MRSVRLRTAERALVTIPNSEFAAARIENLSRRDKLLLVRLELALPDGDLFRVRVGERDGGALRLDLLLERIDMRFRGLVRRSSLIELLRRDDVLANETLIAFEIEARVLQVGLGFGLLRLAGGQRRFSLADLIGVLATLIAQSRLRLANLGAQSGRIGGIVGRFSFELVGHDDGEKLVPRDRVSLLDQKTTDLSRDLRAHDHFVGGHDAGQDELGRSAAGVVRGGACGRNQHDEQADSLAFHSGDLLEASTLPDHTRGRS